MTDMIVTFDTAFDTAARDMGYQESIYQRNIHGKNSCCYFEKDIEKVIKCCQTMHQIVMKSFKDIAACSCKQDLTGFHFGYVSAVLIRHLRIYLYMLLIDEFRMYCK